MDGDVFGAVSRVGRNAADALVRALDGSPWDESSACRCLDILIATAQGVPSLPGVLQVLCEYQASPLLAALRDAAADQIDPDVRFARTLSMTKEVPTSEAEAGILKMYQRYASEIASFLERARPAIARRPNAQPRKVVERDLFVAAG